MQGAKMAEDLNEVIENALNVIVSITGSRGNMKKELKTTLSDRMSNLRKLFAKLIDTNENNGRKIIELEKQEANTKEKREVVRSRAQNYIAEPSSAPERKKNGQTVSKVAQLTGRRDKLYSEVVVGRTTQKVYKITLTFKDNQTAETIKEKMKSQINPAEIKVGIESIKTIRDGRVQRETGSFQEAETLEKSITDELGDKIDSHIQRPRKPRLKIINIPEDISTYNIEDTPMAQNPEIVIAIGEIIPKFTYESKRHTRNIVMEFSAQTRKKLIDIKVKIGCINCSMEDYLVATRCFRFSRFINRMRDCIGTATCPLCADNHTLTECKAEPTEYKCINCRSYNHHSRNTKINENHSSLDRNCPSMKAIIEKYKKNTEY